MGKLYTIEELQNMLFADIEYKIPESVQHILKHIESQLDISEATTTSSLSHPKKDNVSATHTKSFMKKPQFMGGAKYGGGGNSAGHGNDNKKKQTNKSKEVSGEEWEAMRNFKATKIGVKSGIDKVWNDIRVVLNKMSASTYEKIKEQAMTLIDEFFVGEYNTVENGNMLAANILGLCSGNKLYAELFANFYRELYDKYELFQESVASFVDETLTQTIIEYVDSDKDYDEYCKYNKRIETRKVKNVFIIQLMKKEMVSQPKVLEIVKWYIDNIETNIVMENRSKEVEDLTENLFILVSNNTSVFSQYDIWNDAIYPSIETLGKSNNKSYPSSSNRIVFKFVDILDSL